MVIIYDFILIIAYNLNFIPTGTQKTRGVCVNFEFYPHFDIFLKKVGNIIEKTWISINGWRKCKHCEKRTHARRIISQDIELCSYCVKLLKRHNKKLVLDNNTVKLPSYYKEKILEKISGGINPVTGKRNYLKTNRKVLFTDTKVRLKYLSMKDRHINKDKINPVITYDDFLLVFKSNCVYCGSKEDITIDRIDSSRGYVIDNVQPLCKICNVMKWNHKEIDFLSHIMNICKHKHLL